MVSAESAAIRPEEVLALVPQQAPFRFIDEILELDDEHIVAAYTFPSDADFYRGHFPGNPITPGVILIETMAQAGVVALYQTCPHLGCRVPECATSQWFECPCHGSQYNRVGEKKGGPAPRGMDRFPMKVTAANELSVDTGVIIQGPPIGVNTTGQEAEGPNCISGGGDH